jgi:hypothetical protein
MNASGKQDAPRIPNEGAPVVSERPEKKKRLDRGSVRAIAWAAGAASFVLPWAAFQLIPRPAANVAAPQQVIVAPAGSTVTLTRSPAGTVSGVKIVTPKGATTGNAASPTRPVATTRGSAPPPV